MIPIYRAKKKNGSGYITGNYIDVEFSNEEYVDIDETEEIIKHCIIKNSRTLHDDFEYCNFEIEEIDISTLSIHFPDMIDSQGNKIFASLQEDGKGGDILDCRIAVNCDKPTRLKTIKYTKPYRFTIGVYDIDAYARKYIVGIQE